MAKYVLCDWEINNYNDSDFMLMYYDDVSQTLHAYEYDTTRFGGCFCKNIPVPSIGQTSGFHFHGSEGVKPEYFLLPTVDVVESARKVLESKIAERLILADKAEVDNPEPSELVVGMKVRLTSDAKNQVVDVIPCLKCLSSPGKWVNPRNEHDIRQCFYCKGLGSTKGEKKKVNGKLEYRVIPVGTVGEVVSFGSYGKFYRGGYRQPNRENTTVKLRIADGSIVSASLSKLRLDRDYHSKEEIVSKARELSFHYEFQAVGGVRCAWLTHNFAKQVEVNHACG